MEYKEKAIKDVRDFMDGGDPKIHGMKFIMWLTKSEENLMKLSHYSHEEYKAIIPILVDVVISDFKKHYNVISKNSDEYKRFVFKRSEMFDKDKRFNVHLTVTDFDLLMDALDLEYRKYIGNEKIERPSASINQPQKKEGCYIATMVYGDYNHPNVLELREFRDKSLRKSILGNKFIGIYYKLSPIFVRAFEDSKSINRIIKRILDKLVRTLKAQKNVW